MGYVKEKVSFLKGLSEGMKINKETNEGKLMLAMIDVLDEIAQVVDDLEVAQDDMNDQIKDIEEYQEELKDHVDELDEDLTELASILVKDNENNNCNNEEKHIGEVQCPHCNEKLKINEDMVDDEGCIIKCPTCSRDIDIEWECNCGEFCDCGCECDDETEEE